MLVVLVATLIVSGAAGGYMTVRAALHEGGWLKSGDTVAANSAEVSKTVARHAEPMMTSLQQGGEKLQMAMDSVQGAADQVNFDVLPSVSYTMQEMVDVTGTADLFLTHAAGDLDASKLKAAETKQKLDAVIDAVTGLVSEGKKTETAATGFLDAGKLTLNASTAALGSTRKLLDDSDPLMTNLGKISGDGYTYLHPILNPEKKHLTKTDYLKAAAWAALKTAPAGAEFLYYLSNINRSQTVVVSTPHPGVPKTAQKR
jgi:hypothetical protein